jgi:hypothetical protein
MKLMRIVRSILDELLDQAKAAVKGYVKFIWSTPNHLARWGAIFLAAPVLLLGLPLIPGLNAEVARRLAEVILVALCFLGIAGTMFG